jgi:hypothetical protein
MRTIAFFTLALFLFSCGGGSEQERNDPNETIISEPAVPEIVNTPAYAPAAEEKGVSSIYKGECIVFWHPTPEELAADERIVRDQDKMWLTTAEEIKKTWSAKVPVYITSKDSISILVSDTRQVTLSRKARGQDFGAIFYKADKGPFYLDGIRPVEDVSSRIDKYFNQQ